MFNKFFNFLRGYVIMRAYGKGAERFINICLRRNIEIRSPRPADGFLEMCIPLKDFRRIRQAARKSGVRIRIYKKVGLYRLIKASKRRYMFIVGMVLCIIFFAVSSRFIWLVEINGVENSDIDSIIETLDALGIKSGGLKNKIPDGFEIQREILQNTDNIAWAWVYIEGAKARVEIYEDIIPPDVVDKSTPCDMVAVCDGVIKNTVVKSGEKQIHEGSAVSAGDVLVSGKTAVYKEGYPEEYIYVHSAADVFAYTTHRESGVYSLSCDVRTPTGKKKKRYSLEIFGRIFSLPNRKISYKDYDISEKRHELYIPFFGYSGISLNTVSYDEISAESKPISEETALDAAKNDLEERISANLTAGSILTDENIEYVKINDETIKVTLTMNFIQNIAAEQPITVPQNEGEEIFDKQTDRNTAGG